MDDLARHILGVAVEDGPGEIMVRVRRVRGGGVIRTAALLNRTG